MFLRKPAVEGPLLTVQAMIRKNTGQYLAVKRNGAAGTGSWEFPGGRVKPGEALEKALEREVKEGTGLKVSIERFVGWGQGSGLTAGDGKPYDRFVMFFECRLIKGKLRLDHETSDHKWAGLEDIMEFRPLGRPVQDFFGKFMAIPHELLTGGRAIIKE